jgi:hypothetical protein
VRSLLLPPSSHCALGEICMCVSLSVGSTCQCRTRHRWAPRGLRDRVKYFRELMYRVCIRPSRHIMCESAARHANWVTCSERRAGKPSPHYGQRYYCHMLHIMTVRVIIIILHEIFIRCGLTGQVQTTRSCHGLSWRGRRGLRLRLP